MKSLLAVAGVLAALMLGIVLFGGGSSEVQAGTTEVTRAPTGHPICGDNGDDGDDEGTDGGDTGDDDDPSEVSSTPVPSITPDSVALTGDNGGRDWDGFDHDMESDDCFTPLILCNGQPTLDAGVYLFQDPNFGGLCAFYSEENGFIAGFNDIASSFHLVGFPAVELCGDAFHGGFCKTFTGDDPDLSDDGLDFGEGHPSNVSSVYFPNTVSVPGTPGVQTAAADANCDGSVGVSDALSVVTFVADANSGCTGSQLNGGLAGDADCSGAVNSVDATQILRQTAGLVAPSC